MCRLSTNFTILREEVEHPKTFDGLWGPGINPQWSINDVLLFYLLRHLMIHVLFTHLFIYF